MLIHIVGRVKSMSPIETLAVDPKIPIMEMSFWRHMLIRKRPLLKGSALYAQEQQIPLCG
jgi:hypothetical protein